MSQYQSIDKRKVFFEGIDQLTTEDSLKTYLSKNYEVQSCKVPSEVGEIKNRGHGMVIFINTKNVDKLMENRPHRIDGRTVEVFRAVSGQGSLKEKKGVKNLIVSGFKDRLSQSDLRNYFQTYGKINSIDMNNDKNSCCIEFDDYDSVDKALLNQPHTISQVMIQLKKGDRQKTALPGKKPYCIHIRNIPARYDASGLSVLFGRPVHTILMQPSSDGHSSTECWLRGVGDEQWAMALVEYWKRKLPIEPEIEYQIEEDNADLCKYFQMGQCSKSEESCDWQHINCTDYQTCVQFDCLYGHAAGVKKTMSDDGLTQKYRIKITGFQTELTPQSLVQLFNLYNEKQCYINRAHKQTGYLVKIMTIKYAERFILKWHNKEIEGGQKLKCQLELNNFSSTSIADSICANYITENNRTIEPKKCSMDSRPSSANSILQLLDARLADDWEVTRGIPGSAEKVLLIRGKMDRKQLAILKIYTEDNFEDYNRELEALEILKDINNVSKLIDYSSEITSDAWIITERALGRSLHDFIDQDYHNKLGILEAVQLTQQILNIIKNIHSRGIFYGNLKPKHIIIDWDFKKTPIDQAQLTLINLFQANIMSNTSGSTDHLTTRCCYGPLPENMERSQCNSTIDAFGICGIFFRLLTKIDPQYNNNHLPHQQDNVWDVIEDKIVQTAETLDVKRKKPINKKQLKTYLIDTFNIGFNYRDYQPWTMNALEVRLESIREFLMASYLGLETTEAILEQFLFIPYKPAAVCAIETSAYHDIFKKASNAFHEAKKYFQQTNGKHCSWSDGSCTWMNDPFSARNERRHDDILTYHVWSQRTSIIYSFIIRCLATVHGDGDVVTLSIGSLINGAMCSIPIGHYSKAQNYMEEFRMGFMTEMVNLLTSIYKQGKAIQ